MNRLGGFPRLRERTVSNVRAIRLEDLLSGSVDAGSFAATNRGALSLLLSALEVACCEPHIFAQLSHLVVQVLEYTDAEWSRITRGGKALEAGDVVGSTRSADDAGDSGCTLALRRYRLGLCFCSPPATLSFAAAGSPSSCSRNPLLVDLSRALACRRLLLIGSSASGSSTNCPSEKATRHNLPDAALDKLPEQSSLPVPIVEEFNCDNVHKRLDELSGTADRQVGMWLVTTRVHVTSSNSLAAAFVKSEQLNEFKSLAPLLETLDPSTLHSLVSSLVRPLRDVLLDMLWTNYN